MNKPQCFYSPPLVAYLKMNGIEIVKVSKHRQSGRAMFFVKSTPELDEIIQRYKEDEIFHKHYQSIKEVRQLIATV